MQNQTNHSTRDLNEAGVLLANSAFRVSLVKLEPTHDKEGVFLFVLSCECTPQQLEEFLNRYVNEDILIEPKRYDAKLNVLRDRLRKVRIER